MTKWVFLLKLIIIGDAGALVSDWVDFIDNFYF